ncbi:hypothetical protein [Bacillus cereus]|nr:hypothetical protein [Bacillus cereus]
MLSAAKTLAELNPNMTFIYVSGSGTDSTESGRTENGLLRLPFKSAYMFRPGLIIPANSVKSKTKLYQLMYDVMKPFNPLLKRFGKDGYSHSIVESSDLKKIGK